MKRTYLFLFCAVALTLAAHADTIALTLQECRQMALNNSEDAQTARLNLQQAVAEKQAMLSKFFPNVSATGSLMVLPKHFDIEMESMGMQMQLQLQGMYFAGIMLAQPIFAGGQLINGMRLTKKGEECAELLQQQTNKELIYNVDNAFWTYVAVKSKVKMVQQYCARLDSLAQQLNISLSAQLATENDLLMVQAQQQEVQYQLANAQMGEELCALALVATIGSDLENIIEPIFEIVSTFNDSIVLPQINGERIEVSLLKKQIEIAKLQKKMAVGENLPTLAFAGGWAYYNNGKMKMTQMTATGQPYVTTQDMEKSLPIMGMLSLNIPLTAWWEGSAKIRKAKLEISKTQAALQKNERLLNIEQRQAFLNLQNSLLRIQSAALKQKSKTENLRVVTNKYAQAMATTDDLLAAQADFHTAQTDYTEAITQYYIYLANYERICNSF